jgi:hypothetical protein
VERAALVEAGGSYKQRNKTAVRNNRKAVSLRSVVILKTMNHLHVCGTQIYIQI